MCWIVLKRKVSLHTAFTFFFLQFSVGVHKATPRREFGIWNLDLTRTLNYRSGLSGQTNQLGGDHGIGVSGRGVHLDSFLASDIDFLKFYFFSLPNGTGKGA